jgi:hypothetical protein
LPDQWAGRNSDHSGRAKALSIFPGSFGTTERACVAIEALAAAKAGRSFCSLFGMTKDHALLQGGSHERYSASCEVVPFHKTPASSSFFPQPVGPCPLAKRRSTNESFRTRSEAAAFDKAACEACSALQRHICSLTRFMSKFEQIRPNPAQTSALQGKNI